MVNKHFFGRKKELQALKLLLNKSTSSLVVIRGRRRIGKSRLTEEFASAFTKSYTFTGLSPLDGVTDEDQKTEFLRLMRLYKIPLYSSSDDWGDLFYSVAEHCKKGRVLVVIDEITWMAGNDATFLGKLKTTWDLHFKQNPKLIMILSGSNSAWIKEKILKSTGFRGRISHRIKLSELPLNDCNEFWVNNKNEISAFEKFKILGVTGGIPRYLEEVLPMQSAEENLFRLCYQPEGFLFTEFDEIFNDLFGARHPYHKMIVTTLLDKQLSLKEIADKLEREKGGDLSTSLDALRQVGFISRDYTWHIKDGKPSKLSKYRLSDNYLRFYLKYIEPYRTQIETGAMSTLPSGWLSIMGIQFENLVIHNRQTLFNLLGIPANEIINANPYWQNETKEHPGCQIDYLIQTRYGTLYLCEIKFSKNSIDKSVIKSVKQKIERLSHPKGLSVRPILIHVNGVNDSVVDSHFFSNIIDFSDLLKK